MYRIPGLCLGKVLLKKSQAKRTIHDIILFIRGLPPTALGEEKHREYLKSLLETQDKEQGLSFLIGSASELNLWNELIALELVDSRDLTTSMTRNGSMLSGRESVRRETPQVLSGRGETRERQVAENDERIYKGIH